MSNLRQIADETRSILCLQPRRPLFDTFQDDIERKTKHHHFRCL